MDCVYNTVTGQVQGGARFVINEMFSVRGGFLFNFDGRMSILEATIE